MVDLGCSQVQRLYPVHQWSPIKIPLPFHQLLNIHLYHILFSLLVPQRTFQILLTLDHCSLCNLQEILSQCLELGKASSLMPVLLEYQRIKVPELSSLRGTLIILKLSLQLQVDRLYYLMHLQHLNPNHLLHFCKSRSTQCCCSASTCFAKSCSQPPKTQGACCSPSRTWPTGPAYWKLLHWFRARTWYPIGYHGQGLCPQGKFQPF